MRAWPIVRHRDGNLIPPRDNGEGCSLNPFARHESTLLLGFLSQRKRDCVEDLVIGALAVAVAVLSYQLYRDRHQPEGVHIELGPGGLSIQGK